jgi:hypothetical protein
VALVVRPRGEEERVRRTAPSAEPELERPEPVDRERAAVARVQLAAMRELAVRPLFIGVDLPVAEVADEDVAAEPAERRRCDGDAPRSVQLAVLRDPREQRAGCVVHVDEAATLAGDLVAPGRVLLRVGDEDASARALDAERRIVVGKRRIDERARLHDLRPGGVEDVDASVVEVGRVDTRTARCRREGEALVDGAVRRAVVDDLGRGEPAAPGEDLAVFAVEDEERRCARDREACAGAVEDDAGRAAGDTDRQCLLRTGVGVERRRVGTVVDHPPRCRAVRCQAGDEAPRVDERRVGGSRERRLVRDERRDRVGVALGCLQRNCGDEHGCCGSQCKSEES